MNLIGCSGPGAGETIARNIAAGYTHAAIAGGVLAASVGLCWLLTRHKLFPALCAALLLLHPAWTVSAIKGDCGHLKWGLSWLFTAAAALSLLAQLVCWAVGWRSSPPK